MTLLPTCPRVAPCSPPSSTLRVGCADGLRPCLTAPARDALGLSGRDEETGPRQPNKETWLAMGEDERPGSVPPVVRGSIPDVAGQLFLLPKYSPDLNPIEMLFSKLKHWLRKAAGRSLEAVCSALGDILNTVSSSECRNYFAQAGYDLT